MRPHTHRHIHTRTDTHTHTHTHSRTHAHGGIVDSEDLATFESDAWFVQFLRSVCNLFVTNDVAENAVQLATDFWNKIIQNERK